MNLFTIIEARQEAINKVHAKIFKETKLKPMSNLNGTGTWNLTDDELLKKAFAAANGDKLKKLFDGDWGDYPSQSEADLALCGGLAFWTKDKVQLDRLFRRSALIRDKWDEKHGKQTYGERTIDTAWASQTEHYGGEQFTANSNGQTNKGVSCYPIDEPDETPALPEINAKHGDLAAVASQAWDALLKGNEPPELFRYGGNLVRIDEDLTSRPKLTTITEDRMRYYLARAAKWYTRKSTNDGFVKSPAYPPNDVVRDMLARPNPPLPVLSRFVTYPIFSPDGKLIREPGYHHDAQIYYYSPQDFELPAIPKNPTPEDIACARNYLGETIADFPFVSEQEKANALAFMLLPFARDLIDGATPLHMIEKPSPGTGATLLANVLCFPALGQDVPALTEGHNDGEWRKRITAKLMTGASVLFIDNVKRELDSSALSAAITTPVWEDRVLGLSSMVQIPVRCVFIATGNNPVVSAEIARRTIRIRLDAKVDRPWTRGEFKHPHLRDWVAKHRAELLAACLTLIQGWIAAGRPEGVKTLGMFESWAKIIGGILMVAGIEGFLSNLNDFYEESDSEGAAWRAFIAAWWEKYGASVVGVAELFQLVAPENGDPIDLGLGDGTDKSQKIRLGKKLKQMRDRVFERYVITAAGTRTRAQQWQLLEKKAGNG